jgi:hypothetical protein
MGFAVGGSFVAAYQIPLSQRETSTNPEQIASDQNTKEKAAEHNTKTESLWVPTDSVGLYTLVLAVFTLLLVVVSSVQGYFLLRADRTARIAANAADLSARAAVGIQLPIIRAYASNFVISDKPDVAGGTLTLDPTGYKVRYAKPHNVRFKNIGKSTAYPSEFGFGWSRQDLPPEPLYEKIFRCAPGQIIAETGELASDGPILDLTDEIRTSIRNRTSILRIFAYIRYVDFLENAHETRYCWRLNGREGLVREHDAPATYTKKT